MKQITSAREDLAVGLELGEAGVDAASLLVEVEGGPVVHRERGLLFRKGDAEVGLVLLGEKVGVGVVEAVVESDLHLHPP